MNRQFRVKGISGIETRIELLEATAGGYEARITSTGDYGVRESVEFVSDDLLESCLRTGYVVELAPANHVPAEEPAVLTA